MIVRMADITLEEALKLEEKRVAHMYDTERKLAWHLMGYSLCGFPASSSWEVHEDGRVT